MTGYECVAELSCFLAVQKEPKGTGDALKSAVQKLRGFTGTLLVVSGDTPLIKPETLKAFLKLHRKNREALSLISFVAGGADFYGRIIRDGNKLSSNCGGQRCR